MIPSILLSFIIFYKKIYLEKNVGNIIFSLQDIINHTSNLRYNRLRAFSDLLIILWKNSFSLVNFTELFSGLPGSSARDKEKKNSLKIP